MRSQTVSTKLQRIAQQAKHSRFCWVAKVYAKGYITLVTEEPDELIAHVRVCGGSG